MHVDGLYQNPWKTGLLADTDADLPSVAIFVYGITSHKNMSTLSKST